MKRRLTTSIAALLAIFAVSAIAGDATTAPVQAPTHAVQAASKPGRPFPLLPAFGVMVHLKAGVCSQVVNVTAKTVEAGGRGILLLGDRGGPDGDSAFHWMTNAAANPGMPVGRLYAGHYLLVWPHTPIIGHHAFTLASSDCPVAGTTPQSYRANATTVNLTITG